MMKTTQGKVRKNWYIAARSLNFLHVLFLRCLMALFVFAHPHYSLRQKVSNNTSAWALAKHMYQTQGLSSFYHGIGPSAIQSATEKALYFFAYTLFKNIYYSTTQKAHMTPMTNLACGCAAEWAHLPITLPIDCLTTRIQTQSPTNKNESSYALLCAMLSEGGMYKGIQAYTILCLKPAIQYTVYEQVKRLILLSRHHKNNDQHAAVVHMSEESLSALQAFILGMISRAIATILVFPYTRAKTILQNSSKSSSSTNPATTQSIPIMMRDLISEGGLASLFQGLGPELTRGVLSTALMMVAKEKISVIVSAAITRRKPLRE